MSVLVLCKFTPLGFETFLFVLHASYSFVCKFTPLGFETFSRLAVTINAAV